MSCIQTLSGLAKDCSANLGGISEVYIANYDDVTAKTLTDNQISAITMASGKTFKKYAFPRQTGSLTKTATFDDASGQLRYYTNELVLQFNRMETAKRVELTALSLADLVVLVKDANGKVWYLGYDAPVNASASDGQTGTAIGDVNRYSITLRDISAAYPYEVLASVLDGITEE
jgi:hypothetical protein